MLVNILFTLFKANNILQVVSFLIKYVDKQKVQVYIFFKYVAQVVLPLFA